MSKRWKRIAAAPAVFIFLTITVVIVLAYADFYNTFRVHDPWDITHATCPYDALGTVDYQDWWAWKLTTDADWQIEGVELYLSCCYGTDPPPSQPLVLEIYTTTSPFNGSPIASGQFTGTPTDYDSYPNIDTFTITLSSPTTLISGTTFWFALSTTGTAASDYYDLYWSPGSGVGCSATKPSWLVEEDWCDPSTSPPSCSLNATDGGDIMPFAIVGALAGATPTPTPTPTVKATSTPQATPTPVRYTQIYAAEAPVTDTRPVLIVHYNP